MKNSTIILIAIVALISSCTKTKTNIITVTKNDTTVILEKEKSIIGKWTDGIASNNQPIFDSNDIYFSQNVEQKTKYSFSTDSIYIMGLNKVYFTLYSYKIKDSGNTLFLTNILDLNFKTTKYTRLK